RFGSGSRFAPGLADVGTIVVTTRRQHQRKRDHGRDKTAELPHRQGLPPGRGSGFSDALTHAWDLDGDGAFDDGAAATASFTYSQPGTYTAALRVTDPSGASSTDSVPISVGNTPPTAVLDPPVAATPWKVGDAISFSGHATAPQHGTLPASSLTWSLVLEHGYFAVPAPFIRTAIMGSTLSISAPSPQATGGTAYEFVSWLDGGAQTHSIVANATYGVRLGAPAIGQVAARPGPGRVTITWTTDVPADSQVQYG